MNKHTPGPTDGLIIRATDLQQAIEALHNGDLEALDSQLEGLAESAPLCIRREAVAAPELLAAVSDCIADLKHYSSTHGPGPDRRLAALLTAIAKASKSESES